MMTFIHNYPICLQSAHRVPHPRLSFSSGCLLMYATDLLQGQNKVLTELEIWGWKFGFRVWNLNSPQWTPQLFYGNNKLIYSNLLQSGIKFLGKPRYFMLVKKIYYFLQKQNISWFINFKIHGVKEICFTGLVNHCEEKQAVESRKHVHHCFVK